MPSTSLEHLENPQSIRTIFFDVGFTLLRAKPTEAEICQRVCRELGLHIDLDAMRQRLDEGEAYFFQETRKNRSIWGDQQAIDALWVGFYTNLLRPLIQEHDERRLHQLAVAITEEFGKHTSWETYPDVMQTLDALRQHGYTMGIISDWGISLGPILSNLRLTHYFDAVIISAALRHGKPSPHLFEQALERTNSIPDYALHIGDSYIFDVLGARSVGITPILLDRYAKLDQQRMDCLTVHSLTDLLELLEISEEKVE
jgi:REG-2-like HAD superfamily hydrolase